jgi:hypothetical protein
MFNSKGFSELPAMLDHLVSRQGCHRLALASVSALNGKNTLLGVPAEGLPELLCGN